MSSAEFVFSQPRILGYRENAPSEIEPTDIETQNAIVDAWESFFDGEEPMSGVHMGIIVRNIIELSGGLTYKDGISEYILLNPGGDVDHMRFQHRANPNIPGGEATIEIASNQGHGKTIERISWGRDLTSGRPSTMPVITRTHIMEGSKFHSFATQKSSKSGLTPTSIAVEPPVPYDLQSDGKDLLAKTFRYTSKICRKNPPLAA
jgi:hypothetical protein